jgi:hypothetical protein
LNIHFNPNGVKGTSLRDNLVRFCLGGGISVVAALIAARYGPVIGGLFLAFPAIFPCGATLIEKREKLKKQRIGSDGTNRGRLAAALDARGACFGCVGLLAFAVVVWRLLPAHSLPLTLVVATLAWACVSILLWWLEHALPTWPSGPLIKRTTMAHSQQSNDN